MKGQIGLKKFKTWLQRQSRTYRHKFFVPIRLSIEVPQKFYIEELSEEVYTIRLGTPDDIAEMMAVQHSAYEGKAPWSERSLMRDMIYHKDSFYLVAELGGVVLAFIGLWFRGFEAHVTNIATRKDYEGRGLASCLLRNSIQIAKDWGMRWLTLEVRTSNDRAKTLYRTVGFEDQNIKKRYYYPDGEDALNMTIDLKKEMGDQDEY